jgi:hypothetical protein
LDGAPSKKNFGWYAQPNIISNKNFGWWGGWYIKSIKIKTLDGAPPNKIK